MLFLRGGRASARFFGGLFLFLVAALAAAPALAQPAAPDLEVSDISFSAAPQIGVPVTATAKLKNIGGVNTGNFTVQWKINGVQTGLGGHGNLAPNQTSVGNVKHTFTPTGSFTIQFIADPFDQLAELSNSNNSFSRSVTLIPPKPNLVTGNISVSGTPRVGQTVTLSTTVTNVGPVGTPNAVPIRWLANFSPIKTDTVAPFFNGESRGFTHNWTPNTAGSVFITFEADAGNVNDESNESDNNRTITVNVLPPLLPDLTPGGIDFSTSSPQEGKSMTLSATVVNIGNQVSPSVTVRWKVNGAVIHTDTVQPVANGGSQPTSFSWTPSFSGPATFTFEIDPFGAIAESNEGNNSASASVTIAPPPRPDLVVGAISVFPSPTLGQPTTVSTGVNNIGDVPTVSPASLRLLVDGAQVATASVPPLANGSGQGVSLSWTPAQPGPRTLRVEVDYTGSIAEKNESNNQSETSVVVDGPDLTASGITFGSPPTLGQVTTVEALVTNIGGLPSPPIPIQWLVSGSVVRTDTLPPLGVGMQAAQKASFAWTPTAPGLQSVVLVLDPGNVIAESNEGNNGTGTTVLVKDPRPDLVVTDVTFSAPPSVGSTVTAAAALRNDGLQNSGAFNVRWLVNGVVVASGSHPSIPAGFASGSASFSWKPTDEGPTTLRFEADTTDVVDESNETNNGFDEAVNVLPPQVPTLDLTLSASALTKNGHGWYSQNPVRARATLRCPTNMAECTGDFRFKVSSVSGGARFYVVEQASPSGTCLPVADAYSNTALDSFCINHVNTYRLTSGKKEDVDFLLWVQPSGAGALELMASWDVLDDTEVLTVEAADIQPLVLIHGIQGSQPPQRKLVTSQAEAESILDPFLAGYTPLLVNAQKMGYEWNKSLFAVAYDWRQSNVLSAGFLASAMRVLVPRARAVDYVKDDARADVVVHSMGGLVSRGYVQGIAVNPFTGDPEPYQDDVRKLVFLATPHRGFPFDYRTYEGMTWWDFLYDAPTVSGTSYGMAFIQDGYLWPTLAYKHFDPSEDDLFNLCQWLPFQTLPAIRIPYEIRVSGLRGTTTGVYACTLDSLNAFVEHPTRGVFSLREMLPTDDFAPIYLTNNDGVPAGRLAKFPWQKDDNTYLHALNASIQTLVDELGLDNIYTVYGDGAPETDLSYEVDPPPGGSLWSHGRVVDPGEGPDGDDLVPSWSASLDGLVSLPPGQRVLLDASPPGNSTSGSGRHKAIVRHPTLQRDLLPTWLTGVPAPFHTRYDAPLPSLGTLLAVMSACPIDLLVEDSLGRRAGYDPVTGTVIREIPGAIVTTPGVEPHIVLIPNAEIGGMKVVASGYDRGDFQVTVAKAGPGGALPIALFAGETDSGQVDTFTFTNDDEATSLPFAVDDAYGMEQDSTLVVSAPGVVANDVEINALPLTAELVDDVTEGTLTLGTDGGFTYAPPPGFLGEVRFTYRVAAAERTSESPATVSIRVQLPNRPPQARDDAYVTEVDQPIAESAPGVLTNDTDPNEDALSVRLVSDASHGAVTLHEDGSFGYVPDPGFIGDDAFTYVASDGFFDSNVATVRLRVLPPNRPPEAADDVYRTELTGLLEVPAPGVVANDVDPDGDALVVSLQTPPRSGTLTLNPDGSFSYEPGEGFNGLDSFTYVVSDDLVTDEATVFLRPPADCEELYGVDVAADVLLGIDPATGVVRSRLPLGIDVTSAAVAFDSGGRLWGVSELAADPDGLLVFRMDLATGSVREKYSIRLSETKLPLDGARIGVAMGPDGHTLYGISASHLFTLDTKTGEMAAIPADLSPLPLDSEALALPGRCRDLIAYDTRSFGLVRVSPRDGSIEPIGPTDVGRPIDSLAGAPDGALYGVSERTLYRLDVATGDAEVAASLPVEVDAIAFRPTYSSYLCLDRDYDRKTKLSRYVVKLENVSHVSSCDDDDDSSDDDACERHGRKNCSECGHKRSDSDSDCGKCGDKGFYRFQKDGKLWVRTDELPASGIYRLRVQFRSPREKSVRLRVSVGDEHFDLRTDEDDWSYSSTVRVRLAAGSNTIRLKASDRLDVERVVLERDCPALCQGEKESACFDRGVARDGLSRYVVAIEGEAGHRRGEKGCCGGDGHYYVAGGRSRTPGRILAELDVPETGRYLVRFQYRVGDKKQNDESIRLTLGGKSFDFLDAELENSRNWEWSERVEVGLARGRQPIELLSIGRDSVHVERIQLEKVCECGASSPPEGE